ncbi:decarboxylase [Methylobacterium variabile]|uniref:Decarboxylase n=2 Tax=Methylobacterium variabile TaxID=298794 RepID=A0A0J6SQ86_9HYPH|nr:decarboxylase [Methylobacterium variabile]
MPSNLRTSDRSSRRLRPQPVDECATSPAQHIDQFLLMHSARLDQWRDIAVAADAWRAGTKQRVDLETAVQAMEAVEGFHAYPGPKLLAALRDLIAHDDAGGAARMALRISNALLTRSYRERAAEWDPRAELALDEVGDVLPPGLGDADQHRPYFEVLFVTAQPASRWPALAEELRRLRRPEDAFVYEPVFVGSFEDAFCAAVINPSIISVVVPEGFTFRSRYDAPVLREMLRTLGVEDDRSTSALRLAAALKRIRPELDIFILSERRVEELASAPAADCVRRVFYAVEEPLEIHLSILEGVQDRYETPFFDNLKRYARRPIGTFHALPIARGKSVFKSDWIRDMGAFYGINLFLAESSATTGGLDSLLEPTGTIKRAQDMAARAFGADHVFFVTNGTSTSNKMAVQALLGPDDIAIVDRNCHKSHHYGMVLSGVQPIYVEAFPMTEYSMYGAVPLTTIKRAMLALRADGRLERLKLLDLTNCTFDGHMYNVRRVMEECLAIKPDLIFLWDEAWSGFARFSPFLRPRTAMGAAAEIAAWLRDPASLDAYEAQQRDLGSQPSDKALLATRLIPDPRQVRLRVYQTNSTHKSMSAIRQGSMLLVKDVDFHTVEAQFREAVFTHASTSPNQQLIASLDVARRQMELEGYGLVMNAIEIALRIRQAVNTHPLVSRYFNVLGAERMIPAEYRQSGFKDYLDPDATWGDVVRAMREDEFYLDPTRMTLVCGTAGFDGTQFKGLLASRYGIQLNKTSRNSVLLQSNINNTRSDVAHLIRVLVEIARDIENRLTTGGDAERAAFGARVKSLMTDVPDLPNFSRFHQSFREGSGDSTPEGDIRSAFFSAYDPSLCEYVPLFGPDCDRRLREGPEMVSANFVIPYPPGFPIMVPGQVLTQETVDFMRKLDVKEIHGYEKTRGLKLLKPDAIAAKRKAKSPAAANKTSRAA